MGWLKALPGWLPIVAAAVAGGVLVGLLRQPTINGLRDDLAAAQVRTAVAESANVQCEADVTESRLAVARVLRDAEERAARAAAAVAEAEGRAAGHRQAAGYWQSRAARFEDQCAAADDALDEYLEGRQ